MVFSIFYSPDLMQNSWFAELGAYIRECTVFCHICSTNFNEVFFFLNNMLANTELSFKVEGNNVYITQIYLIYSG